MDSRFGSLPNDIEALKAVLIIERNERIAEAARAVAAEAELAVARAKASDDQALIAHQQLRIEKLTRQLYGPRSERTSRLLDQVELQFEELESSATEDEVAAEMAVAKTTTVASFTRKRPARKPFPEHLPRERVIVPGPTTCLCCGGSRLRKLGEDITETLESVPRQCWGGRPRRHRVCQTEVVADLRQRRPSVEQISRIGMDTSKHIFQLHGVNAAEEMILRKKLRRKEMVAFFEKLAPTVIAIEACGASHHWARLLQSFGHTVKLIAAQLVKPYVKRGKNDAADAEALCEAMSRPTMRFVPVKTAEQQSAVMLVSVRDRLIRNRTQLANAIRGYAAEFGFTAAKGITHLEPLLERIQADESVPALARELFAIQAKEYAKLKAQIEQVDAKLMAWQRANECSQRLAKIPGVGPIGAALLIMKTPAPEMFRSGRQFAAWIGLTPKDHSTAGKVRLGVITRAGDEGLRSVLVVGATSAIHHARRRGTTSPWLVELLKRKPPKLAAVALANKMARIAWKLMRTGETYAAKSAPAGLAGAV